MKIYRFNLVRTIASILTVFVVIAAGAQAHMISLYRQKDQHIIKKALDDWYSQKQKNYEEWAKVYPAEAEISVNTVLEEQKNWCKKAEIKGTPTIFINGYSLPDLYSPEDIRYFI